MKPILCPLLLLGLALPAASFAQEGRLPAPRHFEIHRAESKIQVDGVLDEPAWASALVFDLPYEWQPGDNTPPPVKTDFLATYDDDYFYAAWRAHDPKPSEIRAHLMDRDAIDTLVQDDHVVLMIDTFNDERRGFQFRINPLGVQADAIFSENEGIEDFSFDMIWESAGKITAEGYVVEIAIPLNQIRFPRTAGAQTWGLDVGRSYPRSARHRITAYPRDRASTCLLCLVDKVTGFEGLEPGRNIELDPTLTASRTDSIPEGGVPGDRLEEGDFDFEPGLSARWGVTPNISLNAAINPDFSQVEADAAQLNVNERFALFFPEKRPFFLEGIDFFATPLNAVFTRTVADPDWGLKLTGKEGKNAVGLFIADDTEDGNGIILPSNQASSFAVVPGSVRSGVARYRRDVGKGSTVGLLFTGREGDGYHNRVAGLDSFLRFNASNTLKVQLLSSDTLYPESIARSFDQSLEAFGGEAILLDYNYLGEDWSGALTYKDLDPGFRADSGFIPRVDIRDAAANLERKIYGEEEDWYDQINVGLFTRRIEDHSGRLTDQQIDLYANYTGPLQSFLEVSLEQNRTFFVDRLYDGLHRGQALLQIQPSGAARLTLAADIGETVDFEHNQPADLVEITPSAELKLGRHLNAKIDHTMRRLDVESGRLLEANLSQLRLIYNFNVRTFVRGIFQYLDVQPGDQEENLFTQLLFSYKLNPQTVLFLGYSDSRDSFQDEFQNVSLGQTDRAFFFKVGYAWVL